MNVQRKNAAVTKFGEQIKANVDGARIALKESDKNYTDPEIEEIIKAVLNPADPKANTGNTGSSSSKEQKASSEPRPNDDLQDELADIDYDNFTEESFKKYKEIENKLFDRQLYDFEKYRAIGVFEPKQDRFFNVYNALVSIKKTRPEPQSNTRIEGWVAKDLNRQMQDPSNRQENSVYYLLKKY